MMNAKTISPGSRSGFWDKGFPHLPVSRQCFA
jgi:hypothetical protein